MKHAGPEAHARLHPLLEMIRGERGLTEKRPGVFYIRSRAFLHFHEDPGGLYADVRAPGEAEFERIKVDDDRGAAELVERVRRVTASLP